MTTAYLALGLDGTHLLDLLADPDALARWDALPLAFTVLGLDRIDGRPPTGRTVDSSAVAAALAARTTLGRFLVVASPQRDHPYNLARRVASLAHLSRGRSGVLFGVVDAYAPTGPEGGGAWGGAGLGVRLPLTADTALDAVRAVRALEQSWPFDSIIGDRSTGILVNSDQIVHVDLDGVYSIAGPLNAPAPPTGASVIGWLDRGEHAPADDAYPVVDLTFGAGADIEIVDSGADVMGSDAGGVLLRPSPNHDLPDVLSSAEALLASGLRPVSPGGTLRDALTLGEPAGAGGRRAAFGVPQAHPSL
jgi:Luciferase-like monooxygenase